LWYRADLLAAAGLEPPRTWPAFQAAARTLAVQGGDGDMCCGAAAAGALPDAGRTFAAYLAGSGGQIAAPADAGRWSVTLNGSEALAALTFLSELSGGEGGADAQCAAFTRAEAAAALREGRAAMAVLPLTAAPLLRGCAPGEEPCQTPPPGEPETVPAHIRAAPLPGLAAGQAVGSLAAWVIPLNAARAQQAEDFGNWLLSAQGARVWALNGGIPAGNVDAGDQDLFAQAPYLEVLAGIKEYRLPLPPAAGQETVWNVLSSAVHSAVSGQTSPAAALQLSGEQINRVLRQEGMIVQER
jgi:multiple sugar transport system substrate-binding protein